MKHFEEQYQRRKKQDNARAEKLAALLTHALGSERLLSFGTYIWIQLNGMN